MALPKDVPGTKSPYPTRIRNLLVDIVKITTQQQFKYDLKFLLGVMSYYSSFSSYYLILFIDLSKIKNPTAKNNIEKIRLKNKN